MRISYLEEIESKTAFTQRMICSKCGSHGYRIVHQLSPYTDNCWWVECEECDRESDARATRAGAIKRWQRG